MNKSLREAVIERPGREASAEIADVLLVQPGPRSRFPVAEHLSRGDIPATVATDVAEALRELSRGDHVLALLDLTHDRAALTAIRLIRARYPGVAIAGIMDVTNPVLAAEAMATGMTDLLPWPFDARDLALLVADARERVTAAPTADSRATEGLFAQSAAMRKIVAEARVAGAGQQHVCICGEGATGRSLVAETVHRLSDRPVDRFVVVDCAVEGPYELEHGLFGTAADGPRVPNGHPPVERVARESAVYRALNGTLFLKHLAEAPARVQARLAKLLRDREVTVDGRTVVPLDVRVIVSTDSDLDARLGDGRLLGDLIARVGQIRLDVPPLRRRAEDIPLLVVFFARQIGEAQDAPPKNFSRSALTLLSALPWHGNGHELLALLDTLHRSVTRRVIQIDDVLEHASLEGFGARIDSGGSLRDARARFERECISAVLMRHHGRVGEAAKALGIQRTNLYRKVRQLDVSRALLSSRR